MPANGPGTGTVLWSPRNELWRYAGWWDASNTSTTAQTAGGVTTWRDQSRWGNHLTNGTLTAPPIGTRWINNLPAIDFSGTSSALYTAAFNGMSGNSGTVYAVCLVDSATNERIVGMGLTGDTDHGGQNRVAWLSTDGTTHYIYMNSGGGYATCTRATGVPVILTGQRDGDTVRVWRNDVASGSDTGAGTTAWGASLKYAIGGGWGSFGAAPDTFMNGIVGEVIQSPLVDDVTTRYKHWRYLSAKWAVPFGTFSFSPPLVFA